MPACRDHRDKVLQSCALGRLKLFLGLQPQRFGAQHGLAGLGMFAAKGLGLLGIVYGVSAILLSLIFVALAARVAASRTEDPAEMRAEKALFRYSLFYLAAIFAALVVDRGLA